MKQIGGKRRQRALKGAQECTEVLAGEEVTVEGLALDDEGRQVKQSFEESNKGLSTTECGKQGEEKDGVAKCNIQGDAVGITEGWGTDASGAC